jgi:hypothetical protein
VIRQATIAGVRVTLQARALGGLGWTWSFQAEGHAEIPNTGALVDNEEVAFSTALAGALLQLARTSAMRVRNDPKPCPPRAPDV